MVIACLGHMAETIAAMSEIYHYTNTNAYCHIMGKQVDNISVTAVCWSEMANVLLDIRQSFIC